MKEIVLLRYFTEKPQMGEVRNKNNVKPAPHRQNADIELPFTKKKKDMGEAVYDRRVPIFITIIIYLVLAIALISSKIIIDKRDTRSSVMVDLMEMEELMRQFADAQELNDALTQRISAEPVRNIVSSDDGEVTDTRSYRQASSETEDFLKQAQELEDKMRETREAYEQGLLTEERYIEEKKTETRSEDSHAKPIKVEGEVTVYYTLKDPPREAVNLFVPAYQCRAGGRIIVDVIVDRRGVVIAAEVVKGFSAADKCMADTALSAAYKSRFNVYPDAPAKQGGRIIYTFVPQNR